jgi:hypothetical protein
VTLSAPRNGGNRVRRATTDGGVAWHALCGIRVTPTLNETDRGMPDADKS